MQGFQSLSKAIKVIDSVGNGNRNLKSICEDLGLPKSTIYRIIQGLISERYLREINGFGLALGTRIIQLGIKAQNEMPLKKIARPFLEELSDKTLETVHLGIMDEDDVFYLDKIPGKRAIQMRSKVGDRLPLVLTGIGKALILDRTKTEWKRLIKQHKSVCLNNMMMRMENYSSLGYCLDLEDNDDHVHCVAVPIRNKHQQIIAAISISTIKEYMPNSRIQEVLPMIHECAEGIANELTLER